MNPKLSDRIYSWAEMTEEAGGDPFGLFDSGSPEWVELQKWREYPQDLGGVIEAQDNDYAVLLLLMIYQALKAEGK